MRPQIELVGGYFVMQDKFQWILKRRLQPKGPARLTQSVGTIGFYTEIPNMARAIIRLEISDSGATSFEELEALINSWGTHIENAILGDSLL